MKRIAIACLLLLGGAFAPVTAAAAEMLEFAGPTMGTRYMVKVFDPPENVDARTS